MSYAEQVALDRVNENIKRFIWEQVERNTKQVIEGLYGKDMAATLESVLKELNETKERLAEKEAELQIVKEKLSAREKQVIGLLENNRIEHDRVLCALDTLHKFSNEARPGGFNNAQACIDRIKAIK